jgi:PTS system fructose-specific IIC component
MLLERVISKQTIKLDISDVDKWTVIEDLIDLIMESGITADREAIYAAVIDREKQASTGVANGIAIPHARTDGVSELVAALGVSKDGIDFDSVDGNPCHLIFLIVAPHGESTTYLKALTAVAFIGKDQEKISRLKSATSPEELVSILEEFGEGGS